MKSEETGKMRQTQSTSDDTMLISSNLCGDDTFFGIISPGQTRYHGMRVTDFESTFLGGGYFSVANDLCDISNSAWTGIMTDMDYISLYNQGSQYVRSEYWVTYIYNYSNGSSGHNLRFFKGRGANDNYDPVQVGDELGQITFYGQGNSGTTNIVNPGRSAAAIRVLVDSGTISSTSMPSKISFYTHADGASMTEKMVLDGDGYLGIGEADPSVALDVVGDINYTGVIQDVSDRRLKQNITPIENALDGIVELNGYSFTMKNDEDGVIEYGLIAQEVEPVFPELVENKEDGFKVLNYIGLIAPLVEAVKDQQAQIEALESKVETLQEKIAAQE